MKKISISTKAIGKIMRFSIVQLVFMILGVSISSAHEVWSQEVLNQPVSLNAQSTEIKDILNLIEAQTTVKFVFSNSTVKKAHKITINAQSEKLADVLDKILDPLRISYEVVGSRILLKKMDIRTSDVAPLSTKALEAGLPPAFIVKGSIKDRETNEPLTGARVVLQGTSKGTVTDVDGNFTLDLDEKDKNGTLLISYVGYESQTVALNGQNTITIALKSGANLEEVVVTGVFDKRTRMESSVAISVLTAKQMDRIAPLSAADLLKNIPGVFVNSSLGEIRNTVYSRGVSVGSNDGASGYYYVSMQEDGLPITNATYGNYGHDYFLRTDATLGKLEAVRGGTASILGNNAPGGIFNYVSKTGGQTFAGEVRAKYGLEGNGINPFYRTDVNFGGPLSKDKSITYNIGGFWRQSDGARNPGYPMNNGGQLKANLAKTYKNGSIKLFTKYLNDHNAWYEFLPTIGFTDPKLPAGVSQTNSVLIPAVQTDFTINDTGVKKHYDSRDKIHSKDASIGLNWEQKLGNGWSIDNKIRYSSKSTVGNTTAIAYPFAADGLIFYYTGGALGQFGTYSFKDQATGIEFGSIMQTPNIIDGNFVGFNFIDLGSNFPGASIQKNSLLFNPIFYQENRMKEMIDQFTITKKLDKMSFTGGMFYANSNLDRLDGITGVAFTQMTSPHPTLATISIANFDGKTYEWTSPNGIIGGSGAGAAVNLQKATQNQMALFFGHNWAINPKLNFDWGIRYENVSYNGTNQVAAQAASTAGPGGVDKNPLTLYDNGGGKIDATYSYKDQKVATFSYSAGLNYKFSDNQAVYARISEGNKAPDLGMFIGVNTAFGAANLDPIAQKVQQIEIGYKLKTGNTNLFVTPFYSILSNVPQQTSGQETADLTSIYNLPVLYNKYTTKGVEIEANHNFSKQFSVRAVATFQSSIATEFKTWIVGNNGIADDRIETGFSGNETDNNAKAIIRLSPTYSAGKLFASIDFSYMGKRAANVANAFSLPAFNQTNLNLGYNINSKLGLQVNINNVFNQNGIMGWSAPGGFPAALDRQGFTKAQLDANPNAVYSTLSLPPRAYFLTVTYKF